jgi:asparagine synthetase B (glutamine-hydrolysing)
LPDLATGDQPIASEDEGLRIVVNGEFYDFERAQRDLESRGHRLRTRSDSEIALHLYEDFGTACLDQLRGEFAFALWDGPNDTLFAARDRFGIKPLYYTHHRGALYLASEIKALLALGVPARWDRNNLDLPGQVAGREPVNQSLYLWSKAVLPSYVLTVLGDRMEMAHSVEGRLPFLDHHVVELARDLPISQKIRGMTEKYVLREAARPVLTATVYGRHKHPFLTPPSALSPGERLHELVQETLRGSVMASVPFYDQAKVVALLDSLPALTGDARTAFDPILMVLLSACCLHERYKL